MTTPLVIDPLATFSPCGLYRYTLTRKFKDNPNGFVTFIMLNPSTADAVKLDPTVRRCQGFAEAWGWDGLHVVNLYAFRQTDPKLLWVAERAGIDVVGPQNDDYIRAVLKQSDRVVAAWGGNARNARAHDGRLAGIG